MDVGEATPPHFFVVGTGRSGTTLMRALLLGSPQIAIPGETGFVPKLWRTRPLWWGSRGIRVDLFVRLAFANGRLTRSGFTRDSLADCLNRHPPSGPAEAIGRIYRAYGVKNERRIVGDKTPGYVRQLGLLHRIYPSAQVVHMVRNPLDVIASLLVQPWGPTSVEAAAMLWRREQEAALNADLPPGQRLVVRLEDLSVDPAGEMARVARHLGVPLVTDMLSTAGRGDNVMAENIHPDSHRGLREPLNYRSRIGEISTEQARMATWIVGPLATLFGYGSSGIADERLRRAHLVSAQLRLSAFHVKRSWRSARSVLRAVRP